MIEKKKTQIRLLEEEELLQVEGGAEKESIWTAIWEDVYLGLQNLLKP